MNRDHPTQIAYVDQYDGPSSLQQRDDLPNLIDRTERSIYENERDTHREKIKDSIDKLKHAQEQLLDQDASLKNPQTRRKELLGIKQLMAEYKEFQGEHQFVKKRERIIKNGWRHGILGLETNSPD